ncbi:MAG TPA: CBS domain-containing protein [Gemmatimonadaceae bacterium]
MQARDIMTRDPMCVLPSDPIWRAAEMMRYHGIGCTPVVADEGSRRVIGIVTDRDITTRCVARKHSANCRVADHMTATPIHAVLATDDASRVMQKMEAARVRRVPVLTSDGTLAGIISQGDVLRHLGHRDPVAFERAMEHVYAGSTFVR